MVDYSYNLAVDDFCFVHTCLELHDFGQSYPYAYTNQGLIDNIFAGWIVKLLCRQKARKSAFLINGGKFFHFEPAGLCYGAP